MKPLALAGRILFAAVFLLSVPGHFQADEVAKAAAAGVPLASVAVPLAGLIALLGGLSVALGYHARIGGALLVLFLVPVTFAMHNFWAVSDPMQHQMQLINFTKNVSLVGAALFFMYAGAGAYSLDAARVAHAHTGDGATAMM